VDTPLRIIVFANGISKPGNLGGDTRIFLELFKKWTMSGVVRPLIITSNECRKTCHDYGLTDGFEYRLWPDAPGVWSLGGHVQSAIHFRRLAKQLAQEIDNCGTIIYSATDFLTDVLPAYRLKQLRPATPWVATRFLFVPHPFKGWKHSYDPGIRIPDVKLLAASAYQKVVFAHILRRADLFIITNEVDKIHFTKKGIAASRVWPIYGGVHFKEINSTPEQAKKYDGCFVGRISPQKGVLDLVQIWAKVCERKPDARLALIGSGHRPFEAQLRRKITDRGLSKNIDLLGFMDGAEKHRIYKSSRVFLHTSVYDNYGMAACEAMAAGVPSVIYDLPPLRIAYPQGCLRARRNDTQSFADAVLHILNDENTHTRLSAEAIEWARTQDWERKAGEVFEFVLTST